MKSTLDPFLRENPDDVDRLLELQHDVFDSFKEMVRDRRKDKLKVPDEELFTGAFWTGRRALELGLIDGIGELTSVMRERYGDKVQFRPVEQRQGWLKQKLGLGANTKSWSLPQGATSSIVEDVLVAIEERGLWNKFGL
jgi:ClpP class serine protease